MAGVVRLTKSGAAPLIEQRRKLLSRKAHGKTVKETRKRR